MSMKHGKSLHIDWKALHNALQMNVPEMKCFLSVEDGTVLKLGPTDSLLPTALSDPTTFRLIGTVDPRIQYQWLEGFVRTVEEPTLRERLEDAINGKGAFRRFKDALLDLPDQRKKWFEYRDREIQKRVVDWVFEQGLNPENEPIWNLTDEESAAPTKMEPATTSVDIDALRDFIIHWFEKNELGQAVTPIKLEELAHAIGDAFSIKSNE